MYRSTSEEHLPDEAVLVANAIGGDTGAFGRLYDMHVDRVYRHIYYRIGNQADAQDLTQQVFLKAWQSLAKYKRTASPFIAWLLTISHNLAIDFYRTSKARVYLESEVPADDAASDPEKATEKSLNQQRLRRAILQLGAIEQQVVTMRFMEGFGFAEIASVLNKNEGNIRVILHRALAKLRTILENEK